MYEEKFQELIDFAKLQEDSLKKKINELLEKRQQELWDTERLQEKVQEHQASESRVVMSTL